jgi:small subunit ribosomal protein S6
MANNGMANYETLMLVRTEITGDEINALESLIEKIVSGKNGKMTLFDKWGKYKLCYPVKKNLYGIYILTRFQVPNDQLTAFFAEFDLVFRIKFNEVVMRHVTTKLSEATSTLYKRPEPIGSHGTSNLDSFIKENKMKGLIETPVEEEGNWSEEESFVAEQQKPETAESEE